jgi:streptogramin lyase
VVSIALESDGELACRLLPDRFLATSLSPGARKLGEEDRVRGCHRSVGVVLALTVGVVLGATAPGAAVDKQGQVTEYSAGIRVDASPRAITAGPDGNLWFIESAYPRQIGRITPDGVVTEFSAGISPEVSLSGITAGPDGNVWFTEADRVGRITPDGVVTEFSAGISPHVTGEAGITAITAGPDGNLWFADYSGRIGKITTDGVVTEFSAGITPDSNPAGITAGPDGNLWFTEAYGNQVGRITPEGVVTEFSTSFGAGPITAGPDGNLWFIEPGGTRMGRVTPKGKVTEFTAGVDGGLGGITAGCDGNLWFTDEGSIGFDEGDTLTGSGIGRITPKGKVTDFSDAFAPDAGVSGITAGPDGNVWFTQSGTDRIGRIGSGPSKPSQGRRGPTLPEVCPRAR